ncbi:MarC family protein [Morganella morganii]
MLVVIWLGNWLLTALGLSADALTVTGGIALLAQGWPMLIRGVKEEHSDIPVSVTPPKDIMRLAMVPLLFPLSMGGGTIAVGISLAGHSDSLSGLIQLSVVILLMLPTIALTFLATGPLHGRLSPGVMDTLARISGIILVTLAIQLLVSGMVGIITTNLKHIADFAG